MHDALVDLSLPRNLQKGVVRLSDRHDMTTAVYCRRKITTQQQHTTSLLGNSDLNSS